MTSLLTVASAQPNELAAAFELVFQHHPDSERRKRVAHALQLIQQHDLISEGVWVARRGRQLIGAFVCLPLVGASALIWPPQVLPGTQAREAEDSLIQCASKWLRQKGVKLAQ